MTGKGNLRLRLGISWRKLFWLWLAVSASGAPALELQAHRGGRGLWPENTLAAFDQALALGVDTLELDIAMTVDDAIVVSHDMALNPMHTRDADGAWLTTTGARIRTLTLAQLQRYDVGRIRPGTDYARHFASQLPRDGERIPTLAAVFALANARRADTVRFNIETKIDPTRPDASASPDTMVRALLAEIGKAGMTQRVTVQSFDWRTLELVGELAPDMPRAYLTSERGTLKDSRWTAGLAAENFASTPRLVIAAAGESGGRVTWSPFLDDITSRAVEEAQSLGLRVVPWTVNRRAEMNALINVGIDGLITDFPDLLRDEMRVRGFQLPPAYAP